MSFQGQPGNGACACDHIVFAYIDSCTGHMGMMRRRSPAPTHCAAAGLHSRGWRQQQLSERRWQWGGHSGQTGQWFVLDEFCMVALISLALWRQVVAVHCVYIFWVWSGCGMACPKFQNDQSFQRVRVRTLRQPRSWCLASRLMAVGCPLQSCLPRACVDLLRLCALCTHSSRARSFSWRHSCTHTLVPPLRTVYPVCTGNGSCCICCAAATASPPACKRAREVSRRRDALNYWLPCALPTRHQCTIRVHQSARTGAQSQQRASIPPLCALAHSKRAPHHVHSSTPQEPPMHTPTHLHFIVACPGTQLKAISVRSSMRKGPVSLRTKLFKHQAVKAPSSLRPSCLHTNRHSSQCLGTSPRVDRTYSIP